MTYDEACSAIRAMADTEQAPIRMWVVTGAEIADAESRARAGFPAALREVWAHIGAGFFQGDVSGRIRIGRINALMSPDEVVNALEAGAFDESCWPFFDVSDGDYTLLTPYGSVEHTSAPGVCLAKDLGSFISLIVENPEFWGEPLRAPGA